MFPGRGKDQANLCQWEAIVCGVEHLLSNFKVILTKTDDLRHYGDGRQAEMDWISGNLHAAMESFNKATATQK